MLDGRTVHMPDVLADPELQAFGGAEARGLRRQGSGYLSSAKGTPFGVIFLFRSPLARSNNRQIELVETFADQAVIAIENVRLFDEVQARTRDLSEALDQQTATSEVSELFPVRLASWNLCSR